MNYWILFTDTYAGNVVFTTYSEMALWAMLGFGIHNKLAVLSVVVLAAFLASCTNYIIGLLISWLITSGILGKKEAPHKNSRFRLYGSYLPFFVIVPVFGSIAGVLGGLGRINIKRFFGIAVVLQTIYYASYIYLSNIELDNPVNAMLLSTFTIAIASYIFGFLLSFVLKIYRVSNPFQKAPKFKRFLPFLPFLILVPIVGPFASMLTGLGRFSAKWFFVIISSVLLIYYGAIIYL